MPLRVGTTPNNSQFSRTRTGKVRNLVVNLQTCKKCAGKSDTWHATRYQFSLLSHSLTLKKHFNMQVSNMGIHLAIPKIIKHHLCERHFWVDDFPCSRLVGHVIFPTFAQLKNLCPAPTDVHACGLPTRKPSYVAGSKTVRLPTTTVDPVEKCMSCILYMSIQYVHM